MDVELVAQLNAGLADLNDMLAKQNSTMSSFVSAMGSMSRAQNSKTQANNSSIASRNDASNNLDGVSKKTEAAAKATEMSKQAADGFDKAVDGGKNAAWAFSNTVLDITPGMHKYSNSITTATEAVAGLTMLFGPLGKAAALFLGAIGEVTQASLKYSDSVVGAYDAIAKSTGGIGVSAERIMQIGRTAELSSKTIGAMTKGITDLGSDIRSLGHTSGQGVEMYGKLLDVGDKELKRYRNMGYTQEQLIASQTDYVKLQAQIGADMKKNPQDLRRASLDYIDNANRLAEMTGLNEKAQNDALAAAQAQENWNAHLAELELKQTNSTNKAEKDRIAKQIQSERNYALYLSQLDPATNAGGLEMLASKSGVVTQDMLPAIRANPEMQNQIKKIHETGEDQYMEATDSTIAAHKNFMETYGDSMVGAGEAYRNISALNGQGIKMNMFVAQHEGKSLADRKKAFANLVAEQKKKKNQDNGIVAQRAVLESLERQANLAWDLVLQVVSSRLNDMVITFIPMVTKALTLITDNIPIIESTAKVIGIAIATLASVSGAAKIVNMGRSFKEGFGKFLRGESGAIGSSTNPAWVTISEKSGALAAITGGNVLPKVRKANLLDKNGKVLQGAALDARMKKLAGAHESENEEQTGGSIGSMIEALKYASKNAVDIIKGGGALGISLAAVGGGTAAAIWIVGKALPTFSEGMKSFNQVDGTNLKDVGIGLAGIGTGILTMTAGAAGAVLSSIIELVGGKTPLQKAAEQLIDFQKINIDSVKVKANGEAAYEFAKAMSSAMAVATLGTYATSLNDFFDKKPPFADFIKFSEMDVNEKRVKKNAMAFSEFANAMSSYQGSGSIESISTILATSVLNLFKVKPPIKDLVEFSKPNLNPAQTKKNALAFKYFSEAISDYKGTGTGVISALSQLIGSSISKLFDPLGPVDSFVKFSNNPDIGPNAEKNADAFFKFANGMNIMSGGSTVGSSGGSSGGVLGTIGSALVTGANIATSLATLAGSALGGIIHKMIQAESGGNASAAAKTSSAYGLGQFTKGTFEQVAKEKGSPVFGVTWEQYKADPNIQMKAMTYLVQKNSAFLSANKIPVSATSLYLSHFLGEGGVRNLYRHSNDTPISGAVSSAAYNANKSVFAKAGTVGGLKMWAGGKMGEPANVAQAKYGGVFDGPMTGYPMEMHGTEIIVPLDSNSLLKKLATETHGDDMHDSLMASLMPEMSSKLHETEADNIVRMDNEMKIILLDKLSRMLVVLDGRHDTTKKILQCSRI